MATQRLHSGCTAVAQRPHGGYTSVTHRLVAALEAEVLEANARSARATVLEEADGAVDMGGGTPSLGQMLSKLMSCTPSRSGGRSGGRHSILRTPGFTPDDAISAEDAMPRRVEADGPLAFPAFETPSREP